MEISENIETMIKNAPTVLEFINKLKSDKDLAAKYAEVVTADDIQTKINFMKEHGVSDEDIKSLSNKELSDGDLDGINGGTGNVEISISWNPDIDNFMLNQIPWLSKDYDSKWEITMM